MTGVGRRGTAAAGTGLVARFTPLGPLMYPPAPVEAAPVLKTPLEIQAEGRGTAAEAGPVPPASARTPLPTAGEVAPMTAPSPPSGLGDLTQGEVDAIQAT